MKVVVVAAAHWVILHPLACILLVLSCEYENSIDFRYSSPLELLSVHCRIWMLTQHVTWRSVDMCSLQV